MLPLGHHLPSLAKKKHLPKVKLRPSAASARPSSTKSTKTARSAVLALRLPARRGGVAAKVFLVLGACGVDVSPRHPHQHPILLLREKASPNHLPVLCDLLLPRPLCLHRCCPHPAPWRKTMTTMPHRKSVLKIRLHLQPLPSSATRATAQESFLCQTVFRHVATAPSQSWGQAHPKLCSPQVTPLLGLLTGHRRSTWRIAPC